MQKTRVGEVEVVGLSDGQQAYPATNVYPDAGERLEPFRDRLPDGNVEMNFGCFLLRADGRTVLVDTGLGPEAKGRLMDDLSEAGARPDEIDVVFFTHLHGDHTGWNVDRTTGKPTFSNARYLAPKGDWDHYFVSQRAGSFKRDIVPLEPLGCLDLFAGERALSASLTAIPTPGHTPGHSSLVIDSGGERGIILGDVVLSHADVEAPRLSNSFDWDHSIARGTRLALLGRLERESSVVGASHLPAPGLGRFVRVEGKRVWQALEPG